MFDRVVKYLDLRRAARDEAVNTKPLTLVKSRAIKKVQDTLTLPAYTFLQSVVGAINPPRLMFQYNVTVGFDFRIRVESSEISFLRGGSLFIKWRSGSTVSRYRLFGGRINGTNSNALTQFGSFYSGEAIKSNCVFEFWFVSYSFGQAGVQAPVSFLLSKLRNPGTVDDIGINTNTDAPKVIADLGVALPEALPYTQDNQVWLDNA